MTGPGLTTIKALFGASCNRCAFPGCDERLTDPNWSGVRADIAHIRGEKPGSARYAPEMSDAERNAVDNLMILCPNHHREIDQLRPQDWSAERLMEIKSEHEQRCRQVEWAADGQLEFFATLLLNASSRPLPPAAERPHLTVERGVSSRDSLEVVNIGVTEAFSITVEQLEIDERARGVLRIEKDDQPLRRLSPGGRWRCGLYAATMGGGRPPTLRVRWMDEEGNEYDAEFPL